MGVGHITRLHGSDAEPGLDLSQHGEETYRSYLHRGQGAGVDARESQGACEYD